MNNHILNLLQDIRVQYKQSVDLFNKNHDDPSEPYKWKYAARVILLDQIQPKLSELRNSMPIEACKCSLTWEQRIDLLDILIHYELFRIADETEETCQAEEYLKSAIQSLQHSKIDPLDPRISVISLVIFNDHGYIKTYFDRSEESLSSLKKAEEIYQCFTSTDHQLHFKEYICHPSDLFIIDYDNNQDDLNDLIKSIEGMHTKTVYYIAQVYQKLQKADETARYCLLTLQRQYSSLESFDTVDWAQNAALLSQHYFETRDDFATARHMISAALLLMSNLQVYDKSDTFAFKCATIDRIIVAYCLRLLTVSTSSSEQRPEITPETEDSVVNSINCQQVKHHLIEPSERLIELEKQFAISHPDSFESARKIFLTGQSRILSAMKYFTLDDHASAHCDCISDYCQLFLKLKTFETDESRKVAMAQRCIKMLEELLTKLNVEYFLDYHREFSFELTEMYLDVVRSLTLDYRCEESNTRETQAPSVENATILIKKASKINKIIDRGIQSANRFVDLFRDVKGKNLPDKYDEEYVKPLNLVHFYIGKLVYAKITYNLDEKMKNIDITESYYNQVVQYYESNDDHRQYLESLVVLIREMLELLPRKRAELLHNV